VTIGDVSHHRPREATGHGNARVSGAPGEPCRNGVAFIGPWILDPGPGLRTSLVDCSPEQRPTREIPRFAAREVFDVKDGSRDDTLGELRALRADDADVAVLKLSCNYGKGIAMPRGKATVPR
jgi:hypothetical protein